MRVPKELKKFRKVLRKVYLKEVDRKRNKVV